MLLTHSAPAPSSAPLAQASTKAEDSSDEVDYYIFYTIHAVQNFCVILNAKHLNLLESLI
jgi:hypothetical protein